MKRFNFFLILTTLFISISLISCDGGNQQTQNSGNTQEVKPAEVPQVEPIPQPEPKAGPMGFLKTEHDFGIVASGDVVTAEYPFVNATAAPFEIERYYGSCECITAEYTEGPIQPGDSGKVTITFKTKGQPVARYEKIVSLAYVNKPGLLVPLHLNGQVTE